MLLALIILVLLVVFLVGLVMVNRTGNYENVWGIMLWWGGAFLLILSLFSIIKFFLALVL